jgi:hypothetical protein
MGLMFGSMGIAQYALSFYVDTSAAWGADWAWGLPLIVLTVVIHVLALGLINQWSASVSNLVMERRHPTAAFAVVMGTVTLLATIVHAVEAGIWAIAYRLIGALPDLRSAMLYSLSAVTSYGHATLSLESQWQLLGAIEALNGWLLFGLTTAFLFGMLQKVWLLDGKRRN